jgi:lipoate-protein ligase A
VSVGFSQKIQKVVDAEYCQKNGIDVVRRMTGGKLVLHHKEVTYSLCSSDTETFTPTLSDSYRLISEALMLGLGKMGLKSCLADSPPNSYVKGNLPCFSFPAQNEIEISGKKIVGSAQKRTGFKFIQHGSIPLEEDRGFLEAVSNLEENESRVRMISLSQALNRKVDFDWAVEHLISGFVDFFHVDVKPKVMGAEERNLISKIQEGRYSNHDWTFNRIGH